MQQNVKTKKIAPMPNWGFTNDFSVFGEKCRFHYKNVQYENRLEKTRGFLSFCRTFSQFLIKWNILR